MTHYQRNANQNHSKVSSHDGQTATIKKSTNKCWRGCAERATLLHYWWEHKLVQPLREQCGDSLKNWEQTALCCAVLCSVASAVSDSLQHMVRNPPGSCPWFSRQEYWSGLPCPPPGDFPNPGTETVSLVSPALRQVLYPLSHREAPRTAIQPSNPTDGHTPWGNQNWKRRMYPSVHCMEAT